MWKCERKSRAGVQRTRFEIAIDAMTQGGHVILIDPGAIPYIVMRSLVREAEVTR